ncbi:RNApolymerase 14 kDa subunit [Striga asiatica]|uniref:RNApolymerase 14 kDa subunit n=1 Tax=Striga asiatica TaxID=4170 RepID=A0A5A7RAG1_STRAF|nr:RNApolymerase 14 kDa subunit [Striga asiatica]
MAGEHRRRARRPRENERARLLGSHRGDLNADGRGIAALLFTPRRSRASRRGEKIRFRSQRGGDPVRGVAEDAVSEQINYWTASASAFTSGKASTASLRAGGVLYLFGPFSDRCVAEWKVAEMNPYGL